MYFQAWRKYFDFLGDATRSEYWTFVIINIVVVLVLSLGWVVTGSTEGDMLQPNGLAYLVLAFVLFAIIPSLTVTVRRVRDATGSGLWILLLLLPVVGGIVVLVITLMPSKQRWW